MRLGISLTTETKRKAVHMLSGAVFLAFLLIFGRTKLIILLTAVLLGGLLIINRLFLGWKFPVTSWFVRNFERPDVRFAGYATAWYVSGVLIAATMLPNSSEIAAVICALAFGDGISALFGERGKRKLPYNREKTVEGTLAFFAATAVTSSIFVGWLGLPFAAIAAIFESMPLGLDDNFSIPIVGIVFFYIF